MAKISQKKKFEFEVLRTKGNAALKQGATGDDVWALQSFLTSAGYLGRSREPGRYCECTRAALRHFQKCYGLDDSGEADDKTLRLIQRPRCGVPDISPGSSAHGAAPFVLRGCKYNSTDLTFAFANGTSDLPGGREQDIVREAFAAWVAVSPLRFTEVSPNDSPPLTIAWERKNHGDGSPFDDSGSMQGNVLAHAFFPPPCGGPFAGALHFDEFESWTDAATSGAIRLLNVAIHEIGHLLGLDHSNDQNAIMFAFYDDNVDSLRQDDINGIQALYGRPTGPVPIRGSLGGTGQNQSHRITAQPGRLRVTLRGPTGQDFDLYVRAGMPPTRTLFDARGFSSSPNEDVQLDVSGGDVFILVDSWRGAGAYEVQLAFA
jgi:hypothetical protein